MSRPEAVSFCNNIVEDLNVAMISIATPGQEYFTWPHKSPAVKALLRTEFYDVGCRDPEDLPPIDATEATRIAQFVKACRHEGMDIIVHCDGGISRSAGVAKAIAYFYNIPYEEILVGHHISPNQGVFETVVKWMETHRAGPDDYVGKVRLRARNALPEAAVNAMEGYPVLYRYTEPDQDGVFLIGTQPDRSCGPIPATWNDVEEVKP